MSLNDFNQLLVFLPLSSAQLKQFHSRTINGTHAEAQPIWGELLTGCSWYENGCYSYAAVGKDANDLHVFDESRLRKPVWMANAEPPNVSINVPILQPRKSGRIWLSDGSLPINRSVSPSALAREPMFSVYRSRPYNSQRLAKGSYVQLAENCLAIETNRLNCALEIFENHDWSNFVYRITVFDQLIHLYGIDSLFTDKLAFSVSFKTFLAKLDAAIATIFLRKNGAAFVIASAYSHVPCKGMINLNSALMQMGLLVKARAGLSHERAVSLTSLGLKQTNHNFTSFDGCIDSSSIAFSPVSGSVFLNRRNKFKDGVVGDLQVESYKLRIQEELRKGLLHFAPEFIDNPDTLTPNVVPDFIVKMTGVGFHNMMDDEVNVSDFPSSVHSSSGFALVSDILSSENISNPAQLGAVLALNNG